MRTLSAALVALVVLLSGCISDGEPVEAAAVAPQSAVPEAPAPEAEDPPPAEEPEPAPEVNATEPAPAPEPEAPAPPAPPEPSFRIERGFGNLTAVGLGAEGPDGEDVCCAAVRPDATSSGFLRTTVLEPGATALLVELRWTNATFDLDLVLKAPDYAERQPSQDDARTYVGHRYTALAQDASGRTGLLLADAEALALTGEWTVEVQSKGPSNTAFEIAVTQVRLAPLPDGWTAFS